MILQHQRHNQAQEAICKFLTLLEAQHKQAFRSCHAVKRTSIVVAIRDRLTQQEIGWGSFADKQSKICKGAQLCQAKQLQAWLDQPEPAVWQHCLHEGCNHGNLQLAGTVRKFASKIHAPKPWTLPA